MYRYSILIVQMKYRQTIKIKLSNMQKKLKNIDNFLIYENSVKKQNEIQL